MVDYDHFYGLLSLLEAPILVAIQIQVTELPILFSSFVVVEESLYHC